MEKEEEYLIVKMVTLHNTVYNLKDGGGNFERQNIKRAKK